MIKVGEKHGRWTVMAAPQTCPTPKVLCRCECGKERPVLVHHLAGGRSTSCGCTRRAKRTHGAASGGTYASMSPEYHSWRAMRERCSRPSYHAYHLYGGRGIRVCDRWNDFAAFLADMGPKPTPKHSIERKDSNGNYEPSNCRWATKIEQARNTSRNHIITYAGESLTLAEWAERTKFTSAAILTRLRRGWPVETALTRPLGRWI